MLNIMTKEGIREGIRRIISNDCVFLNDEKVYLDECSEDILIYLHSQGLVRKVDKEIENPYQNSWMPVEREAYNKAIQDGLVAVELII